MRFLLASFLLAAAAACGPREVQVRTAPPIASQSAIQLTNGLSQAVNVYVTYNGSDRFIQQVRGNTALRLPVNGIPHGATVSLKAVTIDGTQTFNVPNIVLSGTYSFSIP